VNNNNNESNRNENHIYSNEPEIDGDEMSWKDVQGVVGVIAIIGLFIILLGLVSGLYDYIVSTMDTIVASIKTLFNISIFSGVILVVIALLTLLLRGMRKR
jgi:hypothetical protein